MHPVLTSIFTRNITDCILNTQILDVSIMIATDLIEFVKSLFITIDGPRR